MITEADLSYEDMTKRAKTHVCGQCAGPLNIAWYDGGWILRCQDIAHNTITSHRKKSADYLEGEKLFRRLQGMDSKALMEMPEAQMMVRVGQAKWPKDLTKAENEMITKIAVSYGFDPLLSELMIYQGAPYVTINGRYRKAQESNQFDGLNSRPATQAEREARNAGEGDYLYMAEAWRKGSGHPFVGWGRVKAKETKGNENLPVVKDPDRQAEKRAESMALRKGFSLPIPLPSWEEAQERLAETPSGLVDTGTGEIVEVEGEVVKQTTTEEAPPPPPAPAQATEAAVSNMHQVAKEQGWSVADIMARIETLQWDRPGMWRDLSQDQVQALVDYMKENPKAETSKAEAA